MLHEWVGYGGTIKKWGVSYRSMDYPGQEMSCKGVVTALRQEGGEDLVDLDIWTANPEGQKTTPGTATVALPSRGLTGLCPPGALRGSCTPRVPGCRLPTSTRGAGS